MRPEPSQSLAHPSPRQCDERGRRERWGSLALTLDEPVRERIRGRAAAGMFGISGYYQCLSGSANRRFLDGYRRRFGELAPSIGSISESVSVERPV